MFHFHRIIPGFMGKGGGSVDHRNTGSKSWGTQVLAPLSSTNAELNTQLPTFRWQAGLWKGGRRRRHEHVAMRQFRPRRKTPLAMVALIHLLCVFLGCQTIRRRSTSWSTLTTRSLYPNLCALPAALWVPCFPYSPPPLPDFWIKSVLMK